MAPKASAEVRAVEAACRRLHLERISPAAWKALNGAACAFSLDLEVDIEHVSVEHLRALAAALEPLSRAESAQLASELWDWLAQPLGEGKAKSMPRVRALIAVLAQALSKTGDLLPGAASAYLSLLGVEGAERQWSAVFHPAVFRQILRALRGLRRGDLRQRKERAEAGEDGESQVEMEEGEEDAEGALMSSAEALALLGQVVDTCKSRSLCTSAETAALTIEELAMLVSKPIDDAVARQATLGLAGLVARAGGPEHTRRTVAAVIRALMPALMMTQDRVASFQGALPKPLQRARANVLNLLCALVRTHPEVLLTPRPHRPREEAGEEPAKKRPRRKSDEAEEEGEEAEEEPAETQPGAEGEKKAASRRRRPKAKAMDDPIVALLQLLCVTSPDRSEWRSYTADAVITLLSEVADVERRAALAARSGAALTRRLAGKSKDPASETAEPSQEPAPLPIDESNGVIVPADCPPIVAAPTGPAAGSAAVERFILFLAKLLESERVSCRILATEVALGSLERSGRLTDGGSGAARAELVQRLLFSLVRRCSDAVPTVRGRALGGVAGALQSLAKCGDDTSEMLRAITVQRAHPQHVDLPALFRIAAQDEKPTARKSALGMFDTTLTILQRHMGLSGEALAGFFDIRLLARLSADESILVRKASISSLALLVRLCPLPRVCELWRRNALPLVLDVEASVAERAVDELEAAVVNPLAEQQPSKGAKAAEVEEEGAKGKRLSLRMPAVLVGIDSEGIEFLQRGLKLVAKRNDGKLPKGFLDAFARTVKECARPLPLKEWPLAVWAMLEEVVLPGATSSIVDCGMVMDAWTQYAKLTHGGTDAGPAGLGTKILKVLEQLVPTAPQARTEELMLGLCSALSSFAAPPSMIRSMMSAIHTIEATWKAKKLYAGHAKDRAAWRSAFMRSIQQLLSDSVGGPSASAAAPSAKHLEAALFSLGELALLDVSVISEGLITQVQTIATNTIYRGGQRVDLGAAVRGQAFAALGKCCLKKEPLAKKSMELLVVHLNPSESFVVRNNVLIVLGDLCGQYTSLVDRFVECMTDLLRDSNELLRKQASMIIASLLAEDFIKMRGSLLLRFVYVLSDPSESVRGFTECVFARILHRRNSNVFAQSFLDIVCALNGWSGLAQFRGAEGNQEFSLIHAPARRAMIYRFMLSLMSNDQKFNVCAQLVTTLLAAFVDAEEATELPKTTTEPAGQALSDGLSLLCCKEMRICFTTQRAGHDEEEAEAAAGGGGGGGGGGEKAGAADAARAMLSSILKRNMCENIVPVLVQLKSLMEAKHSPFLRQLRNCLREILRDFKDDLQVMLSGDPHLAAEIAFDLQKEAAANEHCGASAVVGGAAGGGSQRAPAAPAGAAALPHIAGASRRQSLGTMMRPPVPIDNGDGEDAQNLQKARRSIIANARRASSGGAGALPAAAGRRRSSAEARLPVEGAASQDTEPAEEEAAGAEDGDEDWKPSARGSKRAKVVEASRRRPARALAAGA